MLVVQAKRNSIIFTSITSKVLRGTFKWRLSQGYNEPTFKALFI